MKCEKCGNEIREGYVHCQFCNNNLLSDENVTVNDFHESVEEKIEEFYKNEELKNKKEKESNTYIVLYIIGLIGMLLGIGFYNSLIYICYIYMTVISVTAIIKYPKDKRCQKIFKLTIFLGVMYILLVIFAILTWNAIWEYMIVHCSGCY